MIEQVELRPVRLADVDALAELYASERAFLAPFDPIRPDEFYTAEGQRIEVEHALAQRAAGSRYRFVIEEAGTLVDNVASQRVLEKNGFERIGLARAYLRIAGAWRDHILFQRVAE